MTSINIVNWRNLAKVLSLVSVFFFVVNVQSLRAASIPSSQELILTIERSLIRDKSKSVFDYTYSNSKEVAKIGSFSSTKNREINIVVNKENNNNSAYEREIQAYQMYMLKHYEVAIQLYKDVIKLCPDNINAKFSLATLYQQNNQFDQAKLLYYQVLTKKEGDASQSTWDSVNKELVINNLLAILIQESPKESLYFLNRLAAKNPSSATILAQTALAYAANKDYLNASSFMERAIIRDTQNRNYRYNLAVIYDKLATFDSKYYEKALNYYKSLANSEVIGDELFIRDTVNERIEYINSLLS